MDYEKIYEKANAYINQGEYDKAIAVGKEHNDEDILARAYMGKGDFDNALMYTEKAIKESHKLIEEYADDADMVEIFEASLKAGEELRDEILKKRNNNSHKTNNSQKKSKKMTNNNSQNKQYEYIVGIDLGHGETSAAFCAVEWDTPLKELSKPVDIELENNKKAIPSAICILDNGNIAIGSEAFQPDKLKQAKVHVCFKKAPTDINGEAEQLMILYMRELYLRIKNRHSAILSEGNHLVYIATPSGWDKPTQDLYEEMAKEAGIPLGGLTKESRAAFIRAKNDTAIGVTKVVDKGAIVFDLGSSTLDFTFMSEKKSPIDHGYNYGASIIENLIYQHHANNDDIKYFEEKYPDLVPALLFKARQAKEDMYSTKNTRIKTSVNFDDMIDDEELEDKRWRIKFEDGELDQLLEKEGYKQNLENAMLDYHQNYINKATIHGVFLTGGAARMDFVMDLIVKSWGVQEKQIFRDNDPSLSISRGVAEVARADLRTGGAEAGLTEEVNNLPPIYDVFAEKFAKKLTDNVENSIYGGIKDFQVGKITTLNSLSIQINSRIDKAIKNTNSKAPIILNESFSSYIAAIRPQVEEIVSHYSSDKVNLDFDTIKLSDIKINLDITNELSSLTDSLMQEGGFMKSIFSKNGLIIGGAAVLFGLIGLAGVGLYKIGDAIWGKSKEEKEVEKRKKVMEKELNHDERQQVVDKFKENAEEIDQKISQSIHDALYKNKSIAIKMNKEVGRVLTEKIQDCIANARKEIA